MIDHRHTILPNMYMNMQQQMLGFKRYTLSFLGVDGVMTIPINSSISFLQVLAGLLTFSCTDWKNVYYVRGLRMRICNQ